jgi:hypothetical protein
MEMQARMAACSLVSCQSAGGAIEMSVISCSSV